MEIKDKREILLTYTKWFKSYILNNRSKSDEEIVDYYLNENNISSEKIIKIIHSLDQIYGGKIVFCGSFGLVLNGLLKRDVHDIDVLYLDSFDNYYDKIKKSNTTTIDLNGNSTEISLKKDINIDESSGTFYVGDKKIYCDKFKLDNINIDILFIEDFYNIQYTNIFYHGKTIKVEIPSSAIHYKKQYIESNKDKIDVSKHLKDLEEVKINLGLI